METIRLEGGGCWRFLELVRLSAMRNQVIFTPAPPPQLLPPGYCHRPGELLTGIVGSVLCTLAAKSNTFTQCYRRWQQFEICGCSKARALQR
ncbi:uncharacterized protein BDZ99DRAFT_49703 [Mytilinidion resinicola]|uniref:Uncharacterized protein n=1 Tax=Mytilinidion resinicola TaxID=574789 RepID=A0A6A6YI42_9PEZI|nr:uncharacterized protein BDZ99DRAFT_49703 [Mytilinidion resinicola]KAF2808228.1 hypothetical protein BDZ99DRAFT_49703 [Mytilinidion resinicola]